MKNKSIWSDTKLNKKYNSINKNIDIDILIIGGGFAGINVLFNLKDKDVILVERNEICNGVTRNTTGKLTFLQDILFNIMKNDLNKAKIYLNSQIDAIKNIRSIINKNKIDCNFEESKSYLFTKDDNNVYKIKLIKKFLEKNNIEVCENDMPLIKNLYSISVKNTYLFNPIKYIDGLLNLIDDNKIYENTKITYINYINNKYICKANDFIICANKIVLATHYPYFIYPYFFPLKCSLEKSYIVSYKDKIENISIISMDNPVISMRNYLDNILFLTNNRNITTKVNDKDNFDDLLKRNNIDYIWSNVDIITNDYLPYIGFINKNFLIVTGFNTWGMTNSVISGLIIKDLINGENNKYINLFNPNRKLNSIRIISDILNSVKGYYQGLIKIVVLSMLN